MASAANLFLPRGTLHIICYPPYVFRRFSRVARFSTGGTCVRRSFIISIVLNNDMLWHFPALGTGDAGFPCFPLVLVWLGTGCIASFRRRGCRILIW